MWVLLWLSYMLAEPSRGRYGVLIEWIPEESWEEEKTRLAEEIIDYARTSSGKICCDMPRVEHEDARAAFDKLEAVSRLPRTWHGCGLRNVLRI